MQTGSTKPKPAKGGAFTSRGRIYMRVTVAPGKRTAHLLPWASSLEAGQERAGIVQALVSRLREAGHEDMVPRIVESASEADATKLAAILRAVDGLTAGHVAKREEPKGGPVTFKTFAERWTTGDLARDFPDVVREKRTADDDVFRLERHVYPRIGDKALAAVTLDDALDVLRRLPGSLSSASRRHVAQLLSRILSLAVYPCREIPASPLPRGFLPKLRKSKAKTALYPDEDAALLACEAVPLASRVLYGFLAREGMRSGEALRLTWNALDLERCAVRLDRNKTDDPRAWALDKGTAEALRRWRKVLGNPSGDALVFAGVVVREHLATDFRANLGTAGVTRTELFEASDARRPIRIHDLRATFVTVALAAGRSEAWVTSRTGHRSSSQVHGYRRTAATFAELGMGWFADMATTIPELAAACTAADAAANGGGPGEGSGPNYAVPKTGLEPVRTFVRRILKPLDVAAEESASQRSAHFDDAEETDHDHAAPVLPRGAAALDDALARSLDRASAAGEWDAVRLLAEELRARRLAATANVVDLEAARKAGR